MKKLFIQPLMAFAVAATMLVGSVQAQSPALADQPVKTKAKKKASQKKLARGATARFPRGSEETVAERSARLRRECKGGVNAGACAGYTR